MNVVEIEGVRKTFGDVLAVSDLSLVVPPGCIYGFIGPNGSGKTTTMRIITQILFPDRGVVRVFGESHRRTATDRIGYLPEERGLYKRMRVRDLLRFYGSLKSGRDVSGDVDGWLDRLGLADRAKKKVETLSKGLSQKVQFLAAVVSAPELLILDEPFAGLDPVNADVIREVVLELRSRGTTILLSTHDMDIAERMCDFILMIHRGRKVLDGTLDSIQSRFGSDILRVRTENGGRASLDDLEDVEKVCDFGQYQELRVRPGQDPQRVLSALVSRTRLKSFEIARPSLHDIFVRIVTSDTPEVSNA